MNDGKTGIFICRCGPNIAEKLNFDELKDRIGGLPGISGVYEDNYFCSPQGKEAIKQIIKRDGLERCCFAACSHRVHEKTFMDTVEEAGLNPYLMQMANIREHVTWVINDKDKATEKAYHQIKGAVGRLKYHKEIEKKYIDVKTDIAIIGGGIAGIKAAKILGSDRKRKVYLIEKESILGGKMSRWEKSYPDMECNPCFLAPELSELGGFKNIEVLTLAEVMEIKGFLGSFIIKIRQKPRYINEACIGCMECFAPCPVSVKNEFNAGQDDRKAVYLPYLGAYPNIAAIDEENCLRSKGDACSKCRENCPFGAVVYDDTEKDREIEAGGIIIATGFDFIDIGDFKEYNYSGSNNIFTNYEFERMMSTGGHTGGHILCRAGAPLAASVDAPVGAPLAAPLAAVPESIAVIYCGGRSKSGYCSGVCCGASMKYAKFVKEHNPACRVYQIYSELCLSGEGLQEMKEALEKDGVEFIRADDYKNIFLKEDGKGITVEFKKNNMENKIKVDMAVVSMGIKNSLSSGSVAGMLDLTYTKDGWFEKKHSKMEPSSSLMAGVYIAGCAGGPKDVPGSILSAKASSADALAVLIPGVKIELEAKITYTDEEKCGGCKMCISVCPYRAISFDEDKKISRVNEILCKGCGTCASLCPAGALINRHFEDSQLEAELENLMV